MSLRTAAKDSSADLLDVYSAGDLAVAVDADGEWLVQAVEKVAKGNLDWILDSIGEAFYQDYGDDYQYITVLLVHDIHLFAAFYAPLANDVSGIGYDAYGPETFDTSRDTQLDGFIFMNYYGLWRDNPASGRYVFGQEFMHRWGAFVNVECEGLDRDALLGRDVAHWSYFLDSPNSPMEGNSWSDNGDGTWTTEHTATSTYSDLDLYLMGFVGADAVGPQTLLQVSDEDQEALGIARETTPGYLACVEGGEEYCGDVTVAATPVTFSLDDVIVSEGSRLPAVADSPRTFRMAFVVVALANDPLDEATMAEVAEVKARFEADWEADVLGLADLDTTLGETTAPPLFPEEEVAEEEVATEKAEAAGCGCDGTGGGVSLLLALSGIAVGRRRR